MQVTKKLFAGDNQSESGPLTLTGGRVRHAPVLGGEHQAPRTC
jgi:hypothetical protein